MKITLTKIIVILGLVLAIVFLLTKEETAKIETVTKTEFIQVSDSKIDTKPITIKPITIKVPVKVPGETITDTIYKDVETQKYVFRDTLKNGIIESTIISDMIHKRDVKLTTFDKETTVETTKTIAQSRMFIGVTFPLSTNNHIENSSLNVYYNVKNKVLLGAGVGYNATINKPYASVTLAIPLK